MTGSQHVDTVVERVWQQLPWIADDVKSAGKSRYARVMKFFDSIYLQVLYSVRAKEKEALEVGIVFDDLSRDKNERNYASFLKQLGENAARLRLVKRDGEKKGHIYLTRFIILEDPEAAYNEATALCCEIVELNLGREQVRESYSSRRREHFLKIQLAK